jgi:hypothetical protein
VLDAHFTELKVQHVNQGDGWNQIETLKRIWDEK